MIRSFLSMSLLAAVMLAAEKGAGSGGGNAVTIKDALTRLDPKADKDWAENGAPSLTRVQVLMKDSTITQAALDDAAGDMRRPQSGLGADKIKKVERSRSAATEDDLASLIDPETGRFNLMEEYEETNKVTGETVWRERRKKVFVKNMHVAAAERGFANGAVRDPGDEFVYTGELGTWMMPADHKRVAEIREEYARQRIESLKPAPVKMTE